MSDVKFDFGKKNIPDKILFTRNVVTKMGLAVATFATPNPTLAVITTATNGLETASNNAADGGKTLTAIMHSKEAALKALVKTLAAYVQEISKGDALIIASAGFEIKNPPHPIGDLDMVHGLVALRSDLSGVLDLKWKRVKGATTYVVQQTVTPTVANSWLQTGIVSMRAKLTVTGLTSLQVMWFRVAAIGTAGMGPYSDPAKQTVA